MSFFFHFDNLDLSRIWKFVFNAINFMFVKGARSLFKRVNTKLANFVMGLFDNRCWVPPLILALMQHDGAELHSQDEEFLLEIQMKAAHTLKNSIEFHVNIRQRARIILLNIVNTQFCGSILTSIKDSSTSFKKFIEPNVQCGTF